MPDKKSDVRVITPIFRVSFPHIIEPRVPPQGGKAKYGVMAVFSPKEFDDQEKARFQDMVRIANEVSIAKFGKPLNQLPGNFKKPFHRGDEKENYGFTADQVFTNLTSHYKPGVAGANGKKIEHPDAETLYPGCYARASVNAYGYDNQGKGIALGLQNLMFVKHGERLDNRVEASADFEAFASGADDLGLDDMIPF